MLTEVNVPAKKEKKEKDPKDPNVRSTTFTIFIPDKKVKESIINSIHEFRAACKKVYSALALAQMAGADITRRNYEIKDEDTGEVITGIDVCVKPNTKKAIEMLQAYGPSSGGEGKKKEYGTEFNIYELRNFSMSFVQTWYSHVADSVRRVVLSTWKAKDPDPDKPLSKGYLVLQGKRALSKFNRIGIPTPFKCLPIDAMSKHKFKIRWDHEIGEVEFTIGKLDGGRYKIWKSLRDKVPGWKLGTVYINEHDRELKLTISYEFPLTDKKINPQGKMNIEFTDDPEYLICMHSDDKLFGSDKISVYETMHWLTELKHKTAYFERCRASVGIGDKGGRPRYLDKKRWRAIQKRVNGITCQRALGEKDRNHAWTRRIIQNAIRNDCGVINIINVPTKQLLGEPWGWYQFNKMLEYKAAEFGIKLNYLATEKNKVA